MPGAPPCRTSGFHPSKEGFKGDRGRPVGCGGRRGFHPSKEGFKDGDEAGMGLIEAGFHPSKEGFKGRIVSRLRITPNEFPSL